MDDNFSVWNWIVPALYLIGVFAIGVWTSRYQKTSQDFFLAGRNMGLFPVGISLCMTIFSAISYMAYANQSYYVGMLMLMSMVTLWIDAPVICLVVIPFFYNLKLYSIYEYLESRFNLSLRMAGSAIFLFWRLFWLATVVYAPCRALQVVLEIATGSPVPLELLVIAIGTTTIIYTFLGGMRAVMWTDVAQFCVMMASVFAILFVIWTTVDGGVAGVWEIARQGGRDAFIEPGLDLESRWSVWGVIPFFFLARLAFYTADQITMQRVLTARSVGAAQKAFVLNCGVLSIFIPILCYIGVGLYAFYEQHPERVPEQYQVAEADRNEAWSQTHPETRERLEDKILPTFIARELPAGIGGLVIAALLAACMSTMDSGLNSITTALIVDYHRRLGIGRAWLARKLNKPADQIDEADELRLARPLVIVIGVFATGFACVIGELGSIFEIAQSALDTPGIPLACVFLLGMLTRRANAVGAAAGLAAGVAFMLWTLLGPILADKGIAFLWPWTSETGQVWKLASIYPGIVGAVVTVGVGYTVSLFAGTTKSRSELKGLSFFGEKSEGVGKV